MERQLRAECRGGGRATRAAVASGPASESEGGCGIGVGFDRSCVCPPPLMDDLASFWVGPVIATPPARLLLPVLVRPKGTHRLLTM